MNKKVLLKIPDTLHKKIKTKAVKEDKTIIQVIVKCLGKEFNDTAK